MSKITMVANRIMLPRLTPTPMAIFDDVLRTADVSLVDEGVADEALDPGVGVPVIWIVMGFIFRMFTICVGSCEFGWNGDVGNTPSVIDWPSEYTM
jgi:hypothetical protein